MSTTDNEPDTSWIPPSAQQPLPAAEPQQCLKRKDATPAFPAAKRSRTSPAADRVYLQPYVRHPVQHMKNGAALPTRTIFDPWNLNSGGHQIEQNKTSSSVGWRESRQRKLAEQLKAGRGGGAPVADLVGRGRENGLGRSIWARNRKGEREQGQKSIDDWCQGNHREKAAEREVSSAHNLDRSSEPVDQIITTDGDEPNVDGPSSPPRTNILANTVFYINGSTQPFISDHALRYLIVRNGGQMSSTLLRNAVTHVILSAKVDAPSTDPSAPPSTLAAYITGQERKAALRKVSAGGALAAGKIAREVRNGVSARAKKVKYVNAKWVLDCIKAGRKVNEVPYIDWRFVAASQGNVMKYFGPGKGLDEEKHGDDKI
jgi:BRCT domain, a BRCA1 C-terminus domain